VRGSGSIGLGGFSESMLAGIRSSTADVMRLVTQASTMPAHSVSLIIIEPSDQLSHQRLDRLVGSSLPQLAPFRSRLVSGPMGVGRPLWAEIDDYDPTSQIHRATIRAPGGQREFADLIAQLSAGSRGHRKAQWEAWSIDGLPDGRWALAVRMSPALSDGGVGAASVWSRLLRSDPHDRRATDRSTQPSLDMPAVGELVTDVVTQLVELQVRSLRLVAETVTGVLGAVRDQLRGTLEHDPMPPPVPSTSGPLPRNVFNAPLTKRRAVAFASISLADLETVSNAFGGDITNVFLAACTLSLRAWLQRHDTVPDDPLVIRMPLDLSGAAAAAFGNRTTAGQIRVPVHLDDPVEVLTNLHTATERITTAHQRDTEKADPTADLARIASLIPATVVHAAMRIYSRLGLRQRLAPICHASVSYVSGEPVLAYCAGAKVVGMHTVAPLVEGCGLNITLTTRGEAIDLNVCACPDNVPAVDDIATGIADSLDILVAAARKSPRGQGRSVVTEMTSHITQHRQGRGY
jgi:diacylglycerol O-acyltransferase / wax synthase